VEKRAKVQILQPQKKTSGVRVGASNNLDNDLVEGDRKSDAQSKERRQKRGGFLFGLGFALDRAQHSDYSITGVLHSVSSSYDAISHALHNFLTHPIASIFESAHSLAAAISHLAHSPLASAIGVISCLSVFVKVNLAFIEKDKQESSPLVSASVSPSSGNKRNLYTDTTGSTTVEAIIAGATASIGVLTIGTIVCAALGVSVNLYAAPLMVISLLVGGVLVSRAIDFSVNKGDSKSSLEEAAEEIKNPDSQLNILQSIENGPLKIAFAKLPPLKQLKLLLPVIDRLVNTEDASSLATLLHSIIAKVSVAEREGESVEDLLLLINWSVRGVAEERVEEALAEVFQERKSSGNAPTTYREVTDAELAERGERRLMDTAISDDTKLNNKGKKSPAPNYAAMVYTNTVWRDESREKMGVFGNIDESWAYSKDSVYPESFIAVAADPKRRILYERLGFEFFEDGRVFIPSMAYMNQRLEYWGYSFRFFLQ